MYKIENQAIATGSKECHGVSPRTFCILSSAMFTLNLDLNSLGIGKTESMQLIMANESLFEQKRRGVH